MVAVRLTVPPTEIEDALVWTVRVTLGGGGGGGL
jgi:hypothetical protein